MDAHRIAIWGNSGSGKSTLAERLSIQLCVPAYHVDMIAWRSGWEYTDEITFLRLHARWVNQPKWVIEGIGCMSGLKRRFRSADLIVKLDTPVAVCRDRAQLRIDEDRLSKNRFIANGCRYADVFHRQWEVIDHFDHQLQPEISAILAREFGSTKQICLDGRRSADELCAELIEVTIESSGSFPPPL
jgi:hypothetical protein